MRVFAGLLGLFSCLVLSTNLYAAVSGGATKLSVVDEFNQPVPNATVLIGYEADQPFPGNQLTTDQAGLATLPGDWKAALPMTVTAAGFITTTIPVALPGLTSIQLTHQEVGNQIEISGTTSGYGTLTNDGKVHFGLVIPGLTREQLLSFDLGSVISPQTDPLKVLGQTFNIPSNISLPDQKSTFVFPVEINKPGFRAFVRNPGTVPVSATHGSFPLSKIVNAVKSGKGWLDMVNEFTFFGTNVTTMNVTGDLADQDLDISQIPLNDSVQVQAPTLEVGQSMLGVAVNEQNGWLMPTDLKRFDSAQAQPLKIAGAPSVLALLTQSSQNLMSAALMKFVQLNALLMGQDNLMSMHPMDDAAPAQNFHQLSYALMPATGTVTPAFLPLVNAPTFDATSNVMKFDMPALPSNLVAAGTYMVLTEIQTAAAGGLGAEQATRVWEVWSTSWVPQMELPKVPFTRNPDRTYRWEVMFLARPANINGVSAVPTGIDLKTVTHVTRNSLDI